MTTIQDVAKAAGVSKTTVSRVLNNKVDDVTPETFQKVRQVMDQMNYVASMAAKGMRSRRTNVIGLLVPDITHPFDLQAIKGVGSAIVGSGYDLLVYASDAPPIAQRALWEREHLARFSSGLTDGTILVTPSTTNLPDDARVVVIDPLGMGPTVPSVISTNHAGALAVMEYLVGLGHRRIGFIGGRSDTQSGIRRFEGYKEGLNAAGIPFNSELVREGDYTRERGCQAALELLTHTERPTAIFAANDSSALGVMDAAKEQDLQIPQDLSVVGFDNITESVLAEPSLTTVDQSIEEMGALATELLIRILNGEELESEIIKVPTKLVVRQSCQKI